MTHLPPADPAHALPVGGSCRGGVVPRPLGGPCAVRAAGDAALMNRGEETLVARSGGGDEWETARHGAVHLRGTCPGADMGVRWTYRQGLGADTGVRRVLKRQGLNTTCSAHWFVPNVDMERTCAH